MMFRIAIVLAVLFLASASGCQKPPEQLPKPSTPEPASAEPRVSPAPFQASAPEFVPPTSPGSPGMEGRGTTSQPESAVAKSGQQAGATQPAANSSPSEEEEGTVRVGRLMGGLLRAARSAVPVPGPKKKDSPDSEAPPFIPPQARP